MRRLREDDESFIYTYIAHPNLISVFVTSRTGEERISAYTKAYNMFLKTSKDKNNLKAPNNFDLK